VIRGILMMALKDLKIRTRYKFIWINMALTPFFMIGPYVLGAKITDQKTLVNNVLVGTLLWYWLNQYFFGVGDGFAEERSEGTLVSVVLSPLPTPGFLFSKAADTFIMNAYLTVFTVIFFRLLGVDITIRWTMVALLVVSGVYISFFSIFFAALNLIYRSTGVINYTVQMGLGLISGMVNPVRNFPVYLRIISYAIPLTYLIEAGRIVLNEGDMERFFGRIAAVSAVSVLYLILGILMLRKAERIIRERGEWEQW